MNKSGLTRAPTNCGSVAPTVYRYIGTEFFVSFLVSFAFFFFIFFINQLLLMAEDILQKDVPFFDVARLVFYSVPAIIALSVPFATLVGALMAVGRLSSDNEVVALRAAGFPLSKIFSPVLVIALLLSGISFFANDYLLPLGTRNFGKLYRELLNANPALELEPFTVKRYQNDTLVTGAVRPGRIDEFVIIDTDAQGNKRTITAGSAELLTEGDPNTIRLVLRDATALSTKSSNSYNYSLAGEMRYNILLEDIAIALRAPGPREMSARDVGRALDEKEQALDIRIRDWEGEVAIRSARAAAVVAATLNGKSSHERARQLTDGVIRLSEPRPFDQSVQVYRLEYHKKFSVPFSAVSFVILAFPLGLYTRRSGRGVGFGIGLLIATVYWAMLIGGQIFGTQRPSVPPAGAMWAPNVLFFVVGIAVFFRRSHR